jgi:hypothetical protein
MDARDSAGGLVGHAEAAEHAVDDVLELLVVLLDVARLVGGRCA